MREIEENPELTPLDIVVAFARCSNYPKDQLGVIALAQGLKRASESTGVDMQRIVDECLQSSQYCPTDYDLLAVARDLAPKQEPDMHAEWRRQYGAPQAFKWPSEKEFWASVDAAKARDAEMWRKIRSILGQDLRRVPWGTIYELQEKLGHPLTKEQRKLMEGR